nr:EAL domain-containing protein [uncultured Romboutsia sp.]
MKFRYNILIISAALIVLILLIFNILLMNEKSTKIQSENIVKVGVYEYEPYIYLDRNGNVTGYYNDLLKLINKKYDFSYEYVECNISEGIDKLKNCDIDIMLGLPIDSRLNEDIIFNQQSIDEEEFGVFSKENIIMSDLKSSKNLKLGLVEDDFNAEWVLKFFKQNNINTEVVYKKNYKELSQLMKEDKIDIMVDNPYKKNKYKMIYKFAGEPIYIAGNKNSSGILANIDKAIEEYRLQNNDSIEKLQLRYFDEDYKKDLINKFILILISFILFLLITFIKIIPQIKKINTKKKIKYKMNKDKYLLQYQPIYNPRNKEIIGFEGLLRLLDEENKLVPPYKFIPEIEKNDMLFDISLWILKKAIEDYNKIKNYKCVSNKNFYISLNISLNEIENDNFVKQAIEILSKSNLEKNNICLEVIERFKINNTNKANKNIKLLRENGFKIAIDDFGIEYSNLDILEKLHIDTIKIDKNFVDGIGKDIIKNEIVLFISKIAKITNKSVVLEGVEEEHQDTIIKKIENDSIYVQGYYYNKPMYLEDIEKL